MRLRTVLGVLAVGLGLVTLLDRGLAGFFDFSYLLVSSVGALAAVVGVHYALGRRGAERSVVEVDPPEPRHSATVPGADVDAGLAATGALGTARRTEIRRRLRQTAEETLITYADYDRESARRAIKEGSWTDDGVAAGYLSKTRHIPARLYVGSLLGRESTTRRCVRRTVAAIEAVRS